MNFRTTTQFLNSSAVSKMTCSLLLAAVADFLFYGQILGWTLGLFVLLMASLRFAHKFKAVTQSRFSSLAFIASLIMSLALMDMIDPGAICLATLAAYPQYSGNLQCCQNGFQKR